MRLRVLPCLLIASLLTASAGFAEHVGSALEHVYRALPESARLKAQSELARADLFLGEMDGDWSISLERALKRGAETVALRSEVHRIPKFNDPDEVRIYLDALSSGALSGLLYRNNTFWGWFSDPPFES
jgi:hypothetical protein